METVPKVSAKSLDKDSVIRNYLRCIAVILFIVVATFARVKGQSQPDLIVRQVDVTQDLTGSFIKKILVTVMNACGKTHAGTSYVLVTFKQNASKDARAIYYVGNTVRPLNGGETYSLAFDVAAQKIGVEAFVLIEADPYKKVSKANEDNNWRTVNPADAGTYLNPPRCSHR